MPLVPKIDEVRIVTNSISPDFLSMTENGLQEHVHPNVVELNGYDLARKNRQSGIHGGICMYFKSNIQYSVLESLPDTSFEVLWIRMSDPFTGRCQLPYSRNCVSSTESRRF